MRAILHLAAVFFWANALLAQDTTPVTAVKPQPTNTGDARLGLTVSKPDLSTTSHLPSLPPGIGFVVSDVEKDGPADKAGIHKLDLIWKMDEQLLVNEGQLATLLRLANPGDEVTISLFREGKHLDLKLTLGTGKDDSAAIIEKMLNDSVNRKEDGDLRIVNVEQKSAQVSNDNGTVEIHRTSDGDAVRIVNTEGELIFEATVKGKPELSLVPDGWRKEVCALRRGLDHATSAYPAPLRQPRPRIVPNEEKIPSE